MRTHLTAALIERAEKNGFKIESLSDGTFDIMDGRRGKPLALHTADSVDGVAAFLDSFEEASKGDQATTHAPRTRRLK